MKLNAAGWEEGFIGGLLTGAERELTLRPGVPAMIEWRGEISATDTAWVAVVIPDDNLSLHREVTGAVWQQ